MFAHLIKDEYDDKSVCIVLNVESPEKAVELAVKAYSTSETDNFYAVELPTITKGYI